jgi:NAD(P)-dependent dehydrogenase (short-subunit alcohol dehydrogenase family)
MSADTSTQEVTPNNLSGRRIVVVGASSGIGQVFARMAILAGAEVVLAARRRALLEQLVAEVGGGHILTADIADSADCARLGQEARAILGSIDLVLFSAGVGPLRKIELQDSQDWTSTFAVNVIGVNLVIAALLPGLAARAIVGVISSEIVGRPRWGLASYGASKAALEESIRAWRTEHPEFRFAVIPIGTTVPTDFSSQFDRDVLNEAFSHWSRAGLQTEMMRREDVAAAIFHALVGTLPTASSGIEYLVVRPPSANTGSPDVFTHAARANELS